MRDNGLLELIFRRDTREIRGVYMIGVAASELIHVGLMMVQMEGTLDDLLGAVFCWGDNRHGERTSPWRGGADS